MDKKFETLIIDKIKKGSQNELIVILELIKMFNGWKIEEISKRIGFNKRKSGLQAAIENMLMSLLKC